MGYVLGFGALNRLHKVNLLMDILMNFLTTLFKIHIIARSLEATDCDANITQFLPLLDGDENELVESVCSVVWRTLTES